MVAKAPRPASIAYLLMVYTGALVLLIALCFVMIYIAETYFNFAMTNSAMGIIVIVVASTMTGNAWFERVQIKPSSGRKWRLAALAAVVTVIIQVAMALLFLETDPQMMRELAGEDATMKALLVAGIWLFDLLIIRSGIWFGVRSSAKQVERLARKQS